MAGILFKHIHTQEVVEATEIRKDVVNFRGKTINLNDVSLHDWELCSIDPGYRGKPPEKKNGAA